MLVTLLFVALYLLARIKARFARRIEDSDLGTLKYFWGSWSGHLDVDRAVNVFISLPGNRSGPLSTAHALMMKVLSNWQIVEKRFLKNFVKEILTEGVPSEYKHVKRIAARRDYDALARLSDLSEISIEVHEETGELLAWIAFLHEWDPEHTRSLILRRDLSVEGYGLTVGM